MNLHNTTIRLAGALAAIAITTAFASALAIDSGRMPGDAYAAVPPVQTGASPTGGVPGNAQG